MDFQALLLVLLAAVAVISLVSRFSRGCYGQLRINQEVSLAFERSMVRDQMAYYTSGPDGYPNAILGVDKSWTLQSDLWKRQDLTAAGMAALVSGMQEKRVPLYGFDVLDHRGLKIGDWFSVLEVHITVAIRGEGIVDISTPDIQ